MVDTPRVRTRKSSPAPGSRGPRKVAAPGYLRKLHAEADKQYGDHTMSMGSDAYRHMNYIPFGHLIGDLCTLGGLQEGQAAMFIGNPGGGKTTQAMRCVAQAQIKYPEHHVIWVDRERTFDPVWAEHHGVAMDRVHMVDALAGEDAVDIMKTAVAEAEELCMLVVDSTPMLTPMKEYEDSVGDAQVALNARLLGRMCSHLSTACLERKRKDWVPVTQIFINQWRHTIGGMPRFDNRTIPGGKQFNHYCSAHLEFKSKVVAEKDDVGNQTMHHVEHVFNVRRNKGASSIRSGEYTVVTGADHRLEIGAYDEAGTIQAQAKKLGLWEGAGRAQRFTQFPDVVFPNMDEGKTWLESHPASALEIKRAIIAAHRVRVGMAELPPDGYLLRW